MKNGERGKLAVQLNLSPESVGGGPVVQSYRTPVAPPIHRDWLRLGRAVKADGAWQAT